MAPSNPNKKVANRLITMSSAAILVVYAAGFMKTRAAAQKLDEASNDRRPVMPAPSTAGELTTPAPIEPPATVVIPSAPKAKSPAVAVPAPAKSIKPVAVPSATPTPVAEPVTPAPAATTDVPAAITKTEDAPAATPALKMPKEHYNDGTYLGWGTSRHGDIQASVKVEGGRIVAASIAQCWTRYSCSWVSHLPPQVVTRQSPDVDYVSGATQSANAFYWAVIDALNKAK
jgi:uncharacterized protein with FMN-binding domain